MIAVLILGLAVFLVVLAITSLYDARHQRSYARVQAELHRTTQETLLTALRLLAVYDPKDVDYPRIIRTLERELERR